MGADGDAGGVRPAAFVGSNRQSCVALCHNRPHGNARLRCGGVQSLAFRFSARCSSGVVNWQRQLHCITILPVFGFARSAGPALGGCRMVSMGGAVAAFFANGLAYLLVIAALLRWRGAAKDITGTRVRILPGNCRRGCAFLPARRKFAVSCCARSASLPLARLRGLCMPLVAADMLGKGSATYGFLLGRFGRRSSASARRAARGCEQDTGQRR